MHIKDLLPVGLILVISVIALSIGAQIVEDVFNDQCTYDGNGLQCYNSTGGTTGTLGDTYASNTSMSGMRGLGEIGSWLPTIGLVLAASIVIGVLVYSFARP